MHPKFVNEHYLPYFIIKQNLFIMKKILTICMVLTLVLCVGNLNAQDYQRAKVEPKGNVLTHAVAKFPTAPVFRGELNEDVESHTAWTINSPGAIQWKYYNKTDATYGFDGADFPNSGEAMAFIVFKPSAVVPPVNHPAHSGVQYFACFNSAQGVTNSWIVSPKFDVESNAKITFWARALTTQYGPEVFKVCISTTGDAQANFTTVISPGANVQVTSTSWKEYSYDIPSDAKYVAINCISNDAFALFIDDIKISGIGAHVPDPCPAITNLQAEIQGTDVKLTWTAAAGTPTGYKVYDGAAVLATVTTTSYVAANLAVGPHTLGVEALYSDDCLPVKVTKTIEMPVPLNPIKNLNGNCLDGVLTLTWNEPDAKEGRGLYWITYSSNTINPESGIGLQDGGTVMAAARFTPADLVANYVETGHKLTKLSFAMNTSGVTAPGLRVWTGGTSVTSPGTLVVTQPLNISEINDGDWTTIDLTTPVNIDVTKELRIGYTCTHPADEFPILYDNGPHVPNKSDLLYAGGWTTLSGALGKSWNTCIKAGIEGEQVFPEVVRYDIYQDNVKIGESGTTSFTANVDGTHNYCVVAIYDNGAQSKKVCKSIKCLNCVPVTNFEVTLSTDCKFATLKWESTEDSFNIYRDGVKIKANHTSKTYVDNGYDKDVEHTWEVAVVCGVSLESERVAVKKQCENSIKENAKLFSIAPNPATNNITITADNNFHTIEVLSFLGQLVLAQPNNGTTAEMDISTLTNGVYFVRIISENGTSVQKFVKQ